MRICTKCEKEKPREEFRRRTEHGRENRWMSQCLECEQEKSRLYKIKQREIALKHYGGDPPKCECCGETIPWFLSIDHIGGGGKLHRIVEDISHICSWLIKHNFPPGFRVLCHNCNQAIAILGKCPHEMLHDLDQQIEETKKVYHANLANQSFQSS